ncbi:MAG: hypothetical protein ACD_21C00171G0005, partial [uncultured bacterium]
MLKWADGENEGGITMQKKRAKARGYLACSS